MRLALGAGKPEVSESTVLEDMGDIDRRPAKSAGVCTGEPIDIIEGAEGGDVAAGTDAKYSAPW